MKITKGFCFLVGFLCFFGVSLSNAQTLFNFGASMLDLTGNSPLTVDTSCMKFPTTLDDSNGFCIEAWIQLDNIGPQTPGSINRNQTTLFFFGDIAGDYFQLDIIGTGGGFNRSLIDSKPIYAGPGRAILSVGGVVRQIDIRIPNAYPGGGFIQNFEVVDGEQWNRENYRYMAFCTSATQTRLSYSVDYTFITPDVEHITLPPLNFTLNQIQGTKTAIIGGNAFCGQKTTPSVKSNGFFGRVDEVRIWKRFLSTNEIDSICQKKTLFAGNQTNLAHYFTFDDQSLTDLVTNTQATFVDSASTTPNPKFFGVGRSALNTVQSSVKFGNSVSFKISAIFDPEGPNGDDPPYIAKVITNNFLGNYSFLVDNNYVGTNNTLVFTNTSTFTYTPNYDLCEASGSLTQTISFQDTNSGPISQIILNVPLDSSVTTGNHTTSTIPAAGGRVNITGNFPIPNHVFDGSIRNRVSVTTGLGVDICANATVSGINKLSCILPAGVGSISINAITICGAPTLNLPIQFTYTPPTISQVLIERNVNTTLMLIRGNNFGPSRDFISNDGDYVTIMGISNTNFSCNVDPTVDNATYINNTHIMCNFNLSQILTYIDVTNASGVVVSIGDQMSGTYNLKNQYVYTSGELTTQVLTGEYAPIVTTGKSNTALIAGVAGGGGALLLILIAIIVIFLVIRSKRGNNQKREAEFIPLSKKNFGPLIFGTEKTFTSDEKRQAGDLSKLEDILVEDDLKLAFAICDVTQVTEADVLSKALVIVFESRNKVMHLLQTFIDNEVQISESAGTLFRSNSMVSKMFKFYSRLIGLPYLYETVGPVLNQMIYDNIGLEVDPEKMSEGADLDEMRWTLMAQSQKILKAILSSVERCPMQFRILCYDLQQSVKGKYPDAINKTIGGFMFLRFFCPAVTSPESYGIVDTPLEANARRLVILITKVMQNLSNDVEFGSKEPYMTKMNDFIHSNRSKLNEFFSNLVHTPTTEGLTPATEAPTREIKENSLLIISTHLKNNISKIKDQELRSRLNNEVYGNTQ